MVENLWAVGAPPRTPLGELTALPRPLAGGEGACCPLINLTPLLAFGSSASIFGHSVLASMKNPGHAFVL